MSTMDRLAKRAAAAPKGADSEILIPLDKLKFDPTQPRKAFHALDGRVAQKDEEYIQELAATIKENGLLQSITVQEQGDGTYLVVIGECRTRAHLLLGMTHIRATVRNDLTNRSRRLISQLTENVSRKDLSDEELALSIRALLAGDADSKPMKQVEIAKQLGVHEGWVTRLVRFGDEELQRVWIIPGIVDSIENLYQVSILPKTVQMDILTRMELPEGDLNRLEKPLTRKEIEALTREAKIAKMRERSGGYEPSAPMPAAADSYASLDNHDMFVPPNVEIFGGSVIDTALQEAVMAGRDGDGEASKRPHEFTADKEYSLPEDARLALLSGGSFDDDYGSSMTSDEVNLAPVHCRVSIGNMESLLKVLAAAEDQGALDSARSIRCELIIPNLLAGKIANHLAGVIVADQEVPAVVQNELVKLG